MNKLFLILLFLPVGLVAQGYTKTVDTPGKYATALFSTAKQWYSENFKGPGIDPPKEDAAQSKLSGRGMVKSLIYSNAVAVNINISFLLTVTVKDGQYKYEFDNIMIEHGQRIALAQFKEGTSKEGTIEMYKSAGMKPPSNKTIEESIDYSKKVVDKADEELNRLIDSLAEKMTN